MFVCLFVFVCLICVCLSLCLWRFSKPYLRPVQERKCMEFNQNVHYCLYFELSYNFFPLLFTLLRLVLIWTNMCWKKLLTKGVSPWDSLSVSLVCPPPSRSPFSLSSFLNLPPSLSFFLYLWVSNCEMCSCCFRVPPFHARPCYILKEQTCVALQIPHVTLVRFDLRSERESHPFTSL